MKSYSFSKNACFIRFTGGGPYDGTTKFCDHDNCDQYSVSTEDGCYNYLRFGPRHFRLSSVNVGDRFIKIWSPNDK